MTVSAALHHPPPRATLDEQKNDVPCQARGGWKTEMGSPLGWAAASPLAHCSAFAVSATITEHRSTHSCGPELLWEGDGTGVGVRLEAAWPGARTVAITLVPVLLQSFVGLVVHHLR